MFIATDTLQAAKLTARLRQGLGVRKVDNEYVHNTFFHDYQFGVTNQPPVCI